MKMAEAAHRLNFETCLGRSGLFLFYLECDWHCKLCFFYFFSIHPFLYTSSYGL